MERSKFNVDKDKEKRTYNNIVFDSQLEMKYYRDVLCPAVESGEVTYFELQKKYELQPKYTHNGKTVLPIIYVADFYMEYADGHIEVVDTKGCPDSVAKLKRKLFWYIYPDIDSISEKNSYLWESNIAAIERQMTEVVSAFTELQKKTEAMFANITPDDISKLTSAMADGQFSEERLVKAYTNQMKGDTDESVEQTERMD